MCPRSTGSVPLSSWASGLSACIGSTVATPLGAEERHCYTKNREEWRTGERGSTAVKGAKIEEVKCDMFCEGTRTVRQASREVWKGYKWEGRTGERQVRCGVRAKGIIGKR